MAVHVTDTRRLMMVTTIGIDPHKATHTAVAIDEDETVLGEITLPADRDQTKRRTIAVRYLFSMVHAVW